MYMEHERAVRGISFRFYTDKKTGEDVAIWFEKNLSLLEARNYFNSLFSQSNVTNAKYETLNNNILPSG